MRACVIITARPSYAKNQTVIAALVARGVDVQIIAAASAVLERYGDVSGAIALDFPETPIHRLWTVHEGENLVTGAQETGTLCHELSGVLSRLQPDVAVITADRREVLGAAQACSYQHVKLVHMQGGEVSGSIDDKVRDSITQLADVHCVCTARARWRVYGLTGSDHIYNTGCASIDLAKRAQWMEPVSFAELGGSGPPLDLSQPFQIVLQHPCTNEMDQAADQMAATLEAISHVQLPRIVLWPGQDAGGAAISKVIRIWKDECPGLSIHTVRSLPPARFLKLLTQASVLVGNSSAGIRECSYIGTPVVNVGTRQRGRERAANVVDVGHDAEQIALVTRAQVAHGTYPSSTLYGEGHAGEQIADVICGVGVVGV